MRRILLIAGGGGRGKEIREKGEEKREVIKWRHDTQNQDDENKGKILIQTFVYIRRKKIICFSQLTRPKDLRN